MSDRVYILNDFENKRTRNDNVNLVPKVNSIDFVTDTDGNTYLKLDKQMGANMTTEAADSYIDFGVSSESKYVVIEADVRVDTPGVRAEISDLKSRGRTLTAGVRLNT